MRIREVVATTVVAAVMGIPAVAYAHPGHDESIGIFHGLGHPFGIDKVLAIIALNLAVLAVLFAVVLVAKRLGARRNNRSIDRVGGHADEA
jgi:hypothetical protein